VTEQKLKENTNHREYPQRRCREILYIGKAKNLRSRVRANGAGQLPNWLRHQDARVGAAITNVEFIVTDNELKLILEATSSSSTSRAELQTQRRRRTAPEADR
jgi:hypothetical protein